MNAEMQPLFWRISDQDKSGFEAVSLLMPAGMAGEDPAEFPTEVCFRSNRSTTHPVDLRWSEEDSDLFMNLLDRLMDAEDGEDIEVDLSDSVIQGIVQLVALARFKTPWPTDELTGDDFITEREELEIGDLVALNTRFGFALAVIVGLDSIDATCVLMDSLMSGDELQVPDHSLLVINRHCVLPASFADSDLGEDAVFH
ncbi:MAG: hypothetical protein CMI02_04710 [Oceanospirillaceae bacterium]|nr:hypothetical protein [Oceanospirillaceae bacterium]MBT11321.1 hypothetical protein [Oceanospirillaceae bacterium]|tara:strand:+ start:117937 stop:118533 length:597 start_codon:yes stop_codon:yes gene_type:complete